MAKRDRDGRGEIEGDRQRQSGAAGEAPSNNLHILACNEICNNSAINCVRVLVYSPRSSRTGGVQFHFHFRFVWVLALSPQGPSSTIVCWALMFAFSGNK